MNGFGDRAVRRFGAVLTTGALVGASAVGVVGGATSATAAAGGLSCVQTSPHPQFDEEPGGFGQEADCVIAVPDRAVNGAAHAGAVEVDQTGAGHVVLSRLNLGLGPATAGDRFGASIEATDLDADGYDDLIVGAPGVANGAGRVYVVYGSADGLGKGRATRVLGSSVRAGDEYGTTLALASYWDDDAIHHVRLLVGAPGTTLGKQHDAGAVYRYSVISRSASDGDPIPATLTVLPTLTEAVHSQTRPAKANERFGASLAMDACSDYVGAPGEVVGTKTGAGAVIAVRGSEVHRWTQDSAHVAGTAEKGDAFGAALAVRESSGKVAVGAPGEDVGRKKDAGSVTVLASRFCAPVSHYLTSRAFAQATLAHSGAPETGDRFGASVAWTSARASDYLELTVGAPGEDVGTVRDAGAVVRFGLNRDACTKSRTMCATVLTQSKGEYTGHVATGNRFGTTITTVSLDDGTFRAVVGAPGYAGGRGFVSTIGSIATFDPSWFHARVGDHAGNVSPIG